MFSLWEHMQFRIIDLAQGTDNWHSWRSSGLGGSTANIIMGVSPFRTPDLEFKIRTGKEKEPPGNDYILKKGLEVEPRINAWVNDKYGMDFKPACIEHATHQWARASLDGLSTTHQKISEYKLLGKADFAKLTAQNKIPDKYIPQVQWNLFLTGYDSCYFAGYWEPADDFYCVCVERDNAYIDGLFKTMEKFWLSLKSGEMPKEISKEIPPSDEFFAAEADYHLILQAYNVLETKLEKAKTKMTGLCNGPYTTGKFFSLTRQKGQVRFDYKANARISEIIKSLTKEELKAIEKKSKPTWRVTQITKEKKDENSVNS